MYKSKSKILHHLKNYHGQRLDELCLAMHPKTKCFYDDEPLEDAFYEFIRFRLSFIFDYSILDTRKYDLAFGMPGEIRLYNSLELDNNLVGIGFFDEIDYIINKINRHKATKYNPFYHNLKYCDDVMKYVDERKEKLYVIKDMIKKQGFDVPIVDPFSGRVINDDRDKDIDNVNKTLCKIR